MKDRAYDSCRQLIIMMIFDYYLIASFMGLVSGMRVEVSDYKDHPCIRQCRQDDVMTCKYNFTVEYYFTLSKACYDCPYNKTDCQRPHCVPANGMPRAIVVANRMLPGPAIHVCKDDIVQVDVYNRLETGEGLSIHWHGIRQIGYQHMDGVDMITQCPIPMDSSFQYKFKVIDKGTHFWHSHSGVQRSDGLFGAFIVREPEDVQKGLYDYDLPEHTMVINSWYNELTINKFNGFYHANLAVFPQSILINGRGRLKEFQIPNTNDSTFTPYEVFKVELGRRYRFRLINNAVANCAVQFSIDNHTLVVIASDGHPFKKIVVETLNIFAGERFDIVLTADQEIGNYWIRVRGLGLCQRTLAFQQAIIRYNGAEGEPPDEPTGYWHAARTGKKLNPFNNKVTDDLISVTSLEAITHANDRALEETPDKRFYLALDFNPVHNLKLHHPEYYPFPLPAPPSGGIDAPQINYITNVRPPAPLLTQYRDVPQDALCNADTVKRNCTEDYCECVHLIKVGLGEIVEFVMMDEGKRYSSAHPMHLHGHHFRVIGMEKLNTTISLEHVIELDKQGLLRRNLTNPPVKDVVTIPDGGYTIIRFFANNQGFWFFHCHVQLHQNNGMSMIIQVGELNQMPKTPKNFPQCRPWKFSGYQEPSDTSNNECTAGVSKLYSHSLIILLTSCVLILYKV